MKNSMNHANRSSTSWIWKPWTVVVLPGSIDLEFFFFFFFGYLQTQPLMKLQPQTLRSQHYLFLFHFSILFTFSICVFCWLLFLHFLFLYVFFVCCFCNFLPPCVFPLKSRDLWSLWRWLTIYELDKNYSKFPQLR